MFYLRLYPQRRFLEIGIRTVVFSDCTPNCATQVRTALLSSWYLSCTCFISWLVWRMLYTTRKMQAFEMFLVIPVLCSCTFRFTGMTCSANFEIYWPPPWPYCSGVLQDVDGLPWANAVSPTPGSRSQLHTSAFNQAKTTNLQGAVDTQKAQVLSLSSSKPKMSQTSRVSDQKYGLLE